MGEGGGGGLCPEISVPCVELGTYSRLLPYDEVLFVSN